MQESGLSHKLNIGQTSRRFAKRGLFENLRCYFSIDLLNVPKIVSEENFGIFVINFLYNAGSNNTKLIALLLHII